MPSPSPSPTYLPSPFLAARAQMQRRVSEEAPIDLGQAARHPLQAPHSATTAPADMVQVDLEHRSSDPQTQSGFLARRPSYERATAAHGSRRQSLDGTRSSTRPRRSLEDVLARAPSPQRPLPRLAEQGEDAAPQEAVRIAVPSATSQDIRDLQLIRRSAMTQSQSSLRAPTGTGRLSGFLQRISVGAVAPSPSRPSPAAETTRSHSGSTMRQMREQGSFAPADFQDRRTFATGSGLDWSMLSPGAQRGPQDVQRNLAVFAEETDNVQSWLPFLKMAPTIAGKMSVAIGADLLTLGISSKGPNHALVWGGLSAVVGGIVAVMVGMQFLMRDMALINPGRILFTRIFSLCGMLLVSGAVILSETDTGAQNLGVRTCGAVLFGFGLTLLNTSLPLSFAYSEMVHGDTFRDYRSEAAFVMWGIGLGLATGLTVSRGAPHDKIMPKVFPFGVAHAFAVLGIAAATFGTCLVATNLQRQTGRLLALRTRLRQLAESVRAETGEVSGAA